MNFRAAWVDDDEAWLTAFFVKHLHDTDPIYSLFSNSLLDKIGFYAMLLINAGNKAVLR